MNKQTLLDEAIELINKKNYIKAANILNQLSLQYPDDSEVLHLLGILNYENNNFEFAIQYFQKAITNNPNNYLSLNSLGLIHFHQKNFDTALDLYTRALKIKPNFPETLFNIANVFIAKNNYKTAIEYLTKAIQLKKSPEYFINLIFCLDKSQIIKDYIEFFDDNYQYFVDNFDILFNLSTVFYNNKFIDKAYIYAQQAYKLNPKNIKLILNFVVICGELGKYDEAIKIGLQGLEIDKFNDVLYNNIGYSYFLNKNFDLAEKFYNIAIKINPDNFLAYYNLGCLYREKGLYTKAIDFFKLTTKINPSHYESFNNLGIIYNHLTLYNEALDIFEFLAEKLPNSAETLMNLGNSYQYNKLIDKSIEAYKKSLAINPDFASCHKNLSFSYFLINDYNKAKDEFEWRFKSDNLNKISIGKKEYSGEDLTNKTIFIYHEQGLGDTIQFVRYLKILKENYNCKIIFLCQKPLYNILKNLKFIDELYYSMDNNIFADYDLSLLSLIKYLNISPTNYYFNTKYLFPEKKIIDKFNNFIKRNNKVNIGIVWRGNPKHKNDHNRSIPIENFIKIFENNFDKFNIYSLQIDLTEHEKNILSIYNIEDIGSNFTDFLDTAAFIENLNLVISVDTSVAHLTGALGKTIFMLIPFAPDWRWGLYGTNDFWYSSLKIFMQNSPNDWSKPFREINYLINNLG
ncbi:MAG TPA: tetratricopeptide repeat protein [Ignavibacteriales bacterium]|nr:tetratricopeptide repeat protein [Ignavibacteriales bacterium]HOL80957.1 tetratricopeptide repeat protein [Ignavibacteriales bacterium]HOM64692.1 tetratricopeptide repeat protein [Ignavibacteriales bacterium]HPD66776.1 tetratricopeptide repeat protein [Ignavibacteriales bacterium]HPP32737.1 tetratricopeptide repeat protein [Ignavibacteriales bacterium]